ncbi:uncharacterized protein BT62DRAFT_932863 [Guyanagaster necrorhizus]|uniref:F-box domain-containing protein n=1 Tax=Guyanagaster necrorhizus TaxID=856835 RepID=A0A9P7VTL9_9AGAR|nr:uncharacterized protein BT62DRAFT_932863 [Guyanagaster necrorhizus MCA 3950]KAG7445706.1 hypothetical protein BT62DRAFT_932863 [Guyanagaster necrorhizus MCA 3950]
MSIRGSNSLPLSDDVIEQIFHCLPSFASLQSTIRVCKDFHRIFNTHPKTTVRRVAYNIAGPALPQAMRLLRYRNENDTDLPSSEGSHADDEVSSDYGPVSNSAAETTNGPPLTQSETKELTKIARVVSKLEDVFSFRHKDRLSKTSKLTSMESWRFRRAIYRLMLFSRVFPGSKYHFLSDDEDDDDDADANLKRLRDDRQAKEDFIDDFFTEEIIEMYAVAHFLVETAEWASLAHVGSIDPTHFGDVALCAGPDAILASYEEGSVVPIQDAAEEMNIVEELITEYIEHPLRTILESTKTVIPAKDKILWNKILSSVEGENDLCKRCGAAEGLNLWCESNWEYLRGTPTFTISQIHQYLRGLLPRSFTECAFLRLQLEPINQPALYMDMVAELFDVKRPEFDDWDKEDLLCTACLKVFVGEHLHLWLLERKRAAGKQIPEDCWYGYNCRTQTHKREHAEKLNHLSLPTRG